MGSPERGERRDDARDATAGDATVDGGSDARDAGADENDNGSADVRVIIIYDGN